MLPEREAQIDPSNLSKESASFLLIEDYLQKRHADKSLAPELLQLLGQDLTTPSRDFMTLRGVCKSEKTAYIHANALGLLLYEIQQKAAKENPLTPDDCRFKITKEMRKDLEIEWGVYLSELEGEASYYSSFY